MDVIPVVLSGSLAHAFELYYTRVFSYGILIAYHQGRSQATLCDSCVLLLLVLRLLLAKTVLLEQSIDLLGRPQVVVHLALLCPAHRRELNLL